MAEHIEIPKAFLIIGGSKIFPIESKIISIGRSFDNDLVLEYPQISRKHAELRYSQGLFEIIDTDSTGGTFVNGVRIKQQTLNKGDVISLVNLHLVFGQDELPDSDSTTQYRKPQDGLQGEQETVILPPEDA
jgi:pSer/pThr/pTyr-binding forkhead associated (FHA) protein